MSRQKVNEVILKNTDIEDPAELKDVLVQQAAVIDRLVAQVKRQQKQIEKINAMYPSTNIVKGKR